ncbi:MAG TPA: hypothetical protein VLH39_08575, partial [Magnetospirillaceae bacterium]|nr:hypothetical protein [Magnetospirillaceae bacterium]
MEIQGTDVYSGDTLTLEVKGGLIIRAGRSEPRPDLPYIGRGFLDMQVNGYRGIDYSGEGLAQADVARMVELLAPTGTTKHVPTIVTSGRDRILRNLETISRAAGSNPRLAAAIPGIHLEGPFISREDGPRGAHDARHVRDPSIGELEEWMAASSSLLKVVTLAPEMDGAVEFIRAGVRLGIAMAIGHTAATAEQIARAVDAGATLSTHLGNGSHAAVPRLRNYLWEQLAQDRLVAGIIA